MPFEKSAGAVVFRKEGGKIYYLLLHYEMGHWGFPKGNIEKGESLEQTVRREVKEETGIEDIEILNGFKEWIKYFYKLTPRQNKFGAGQEAKNIFKIVTYFLAEAKTTEVKISWEHTGFEWLLYKEALNRLAFKNSKEILKKANKHASFS